MQRHAFGIGVFSYNRKELEKATAEGKNVKFTVIGLLRLSNDISPELASETIEEVHVRGVFQAPESVKEELADRIV